MNFREEILEAIRHEKNHKELLAIVRRYKAAGMGQREAYNLLEAIWKELGFDENEDETPIQNELEYVMEVVWGFCPHDPTLWRTSLKNSIKE